MNGVLVSFNPSHLTKIRVWFRNASGVKLGSADDKWGCPHAGKSFRGVLLGKGSVFQSAAASGIAVTLAEARHYQRLLHRGIVALGE